MTSDIYLSVDLNTSKLHPIFMDSATGLPCLTIANFTLVISEDLEHTCCRKLCTLCLRNLQLLLSRGSCALMDPCLA